MKKHIVALTGAGISADSGLKTFRDTGGLWEGHNVNDVATPEGFAKNPQLVIDFYNARRRQNKAAQPNAAHLALKELEQYFTVSVITQNVDNLHEKAGSGSVLHLHGELNKLCSTVDKDYIIDWFDDQPYDLKDKNGNLMRPFIVWFGEAVPKIDDAIHLVEQADIVLIIGTSLAVYPAAGLYQFAPKNAEIHLIDPNPTRLAGIKITAQNAAIGVPLVAEDLIKKCAK